MEVLYQLSYPSKNGFYQQRVMGIEPTCAAWKAAVLPLNYTRKSCWESPDTRQSGRPLCGGELRPQKRMASQAEPSNYIKILIEFADAQKGWSGRLLNLQAAHDAFAVDHVLKVLLRGKLTGEAVAKLSPDQQQRPVAHVIAAVLPEQAVSGGIIHVAGGDIMNTVLPSNLFAKILNASPCSAGDRLRDKSPRTAGSVPQIPRCQ